MPQQGSLITIWPAPPRNKIGGRRDRAAVAKTPAPLSQHYLG
jgi:hypothetical protein